MHRDQLHMLRDGSCHLKSTFSKSQTAWTAIMYVTLRVPWHAMAACHAQRHSWRTDRNEAVRPFAMSLKSPASSAISAIAAEGRFGVYTWQKSSNSGGTSTRTSATAATATFTTPALATAHRPRCECVARVFVALVCVGFSDWCCLQSTQKLSSRERTGRWKALSRTECRHSDHPGWCPHSSMSRPLGACHH